VENGEAFSARHVQATSMLKGMHHRLDYR